MHHFARLTLIILALMVSACQVTPTPQPTQPIALNSPTLRVSTPNPRLTATPLTATLTRAPDTTTPTLSATPTLTPYPTLISQEPYIIFKKSVTGPLILLNAAGNGRKEIALPTGANIPDLAQAVSPDGRWLVVYSGSSEAPYDLTLNLVSLPDGVVHSVTKLLSDSYLENLAQIADYYNPPGNEEVTWEIFKSKILIPALHAFDWSPDGHSLAFAGLMDGPSSDLYIYEIQNEKIYRLTDDLRILTSIAWSPTGEWLAFENADPMVNYVGTTLHTLRTGSGLVHNIPILKEGDLWAGIGWITPDLYLVTGQAVGSDNYNLQVLNVEKGRLIDIWPWDYISYGFDPEEQVFLISCPSTPWDAPVIDRGTYRVSFTGEVEKISERDFWFNGFRGGTETRFIAQDQEGSVAISRSGEITSLLPPSNIYPEILVSPDRQWFVTNAQSSGDYMLTLFSAQDQPVRFLYGYRPTQTVWRARFFRILLHR